LKDQLANFYAEKTLLSREMRSGIEADENKRLMKKYTTIGNNISEIAQRLYETDDEEKRERYFNRIQSIIERIN